MNDNAETERSQAMREMLESTSALEQQPRIDLAARVLARLRQRTTLIASLNEAFQAVYATVNGFIQMVSYRETPGETTSIEPKERE